MKTKRIRGGDWYDLTNVRCARLFRYSPNYRDFYLGFRIVNKRKVRK